MDIGNLIFLCLFIQCIARLWRQQSHLLSAYSQQFVIIPKPKDSLVICTPIQIWPHQLLFSYFMRNDSRGPICNCASHKSTTIMTKSSLKPSLQCVRAIIASSTQPGYFSIRWISGNNDHPINLCGSCGNYAKNIRIPIISQTVNGYQSI